MSLAFSTVKNSKDRYCCECYQIIPSGKTMNVYKFVDKGKPFKDRYATYYLCHDCGLFLVFLDDNGYLTEEVSQEFSIPGFIYGWCQDWSKYGGLRNNNEIRKMAIDKLNQINTTLSEHHKNGTIKDVAKSILDSTKERNKV